MTMAPGSIPEVQGGEREEEEEEEMRAGCYGEGDHEDGVCGAHSGPHSRHNEPARAGGQVPLGTTWEVKDTMQGQEETSIRTSHPIRGWLSSPVPTKSAGQRPAAAGWGDAGAGLRRHRCHHEPLHPPQSSPALESIQAAPPARLNLGGGTQPAGEEASFRRAGAHTRTFISLCALPSLGKSRRQAKLPREI